MDIASSSSRITRPDTRPAPLQPARGTGTPESAHGAGRTPARPQPLGTPATGTPSLWHLLTDAERLFFLSPGRGPLSYGPNAPTEHASEATLPGGRLDVRG